MKTPKTSAPAALPTLESVALDGVTGGCAACGGANGGAQQQGGGGLGALAGMLGGGANGGAGMSQIAGLIGQLGQK